MQRRKFIQLLGPAGIFLSGGHWASPLQAAAAEGLMPQPVYPPEIQSGERLMESCRPYLELNRQQLLSLVPPQGGFYFGACPNCTQGDQENNIVWNLALGEKVQCQFCKVILPSEKYPENQQIEISTPSGKRQLFKYHQAENGRKYWLEGRRWYEQLLVVQRIAYAMAQLYGLDARQFEQAGEYAALLIKKCAEVYPDYILRYETPAQEKRFFTLQSEVDKWKKTYGNGGEYCIAKWSWWAYMDVSRELLLAYDQLAKSTFFTATERQKIERDFFGGMLQFVEQYRDVALSNMHPALWTPQIIASRLFHLADLQRGVVDSMQRMIRENFTYDAFWMEGTASYHLQTAHGLRRVISWLRPDLKGAAFDQWFQKEHRPIYRTIEASKSFCLPNGRYAAVHDSWAKQAYSPAITQSKPYLMGGMGYGILGFGEGANQLQAHLNFSGRFGHVHYDSLNLLLFGAGKELVSELGYTWTKARPWIRATAAHNTVVIDQKSQEHGAAPTNSLGNLRLYQASDPDFQVIKADAPECYPGLAQRYERTLIAVNNAAVEQYVVDIFEVEGGNRHDWFLHGSADEDQSIELMSMGDAGLRLRDAASLLPEGFKFTPLTIPGSADFALIHQGPWAYGNFRDCKNTESNETVRAVFKSTDGSGGALESWILADGKSTLTTMRSWNVRGTGVPGTEDQTKLDDHLRSSLMVTRMGDRNRFIAVHVPFHSLSPVKKVSLIPATNEAIVFKIERQNAVDYIVVSKAGKLCRVNDQGRVILFDGHIGYAGLEAEKWNVKMIDGLQLTAGNRSITGAVPPPAPLLNVENNVYTVSGNLPIAPGDAFLIHHGNQRTTAFHAAQVRHEKQLTVIETQEAAAFEGEVNSTLKLSTFPQLEFPAPHTVTTNVLVTA